MTKQRQVTFMRYFCVAIFLMGLYAPSAFADINCRPKVSQAALATAKSFNKQLVSLLPNSDGNDGGVKDEAQMPLALMKTAVDRLVTAEMACEPVKDFDERKIGSLLQDDLSQIVGRNVKAKTGEPIYGLNGFHVQFYPEHNLLLVRSSFGIPCTDDTELSGYRLFEDGWRKVIGVSSDILANPYGKFRSFAFKDPIFIKDPATGRDNILLVSNPGQCTSYWYGFSTLVIDPAEEYGVQRDVFAFSDIYYNGELSDKGPDVKVKGNKFRLTYLGNSDFVHGGASDTPKVKTFALKGGVVRPIKKF